MFEFYSLGLFRLLDFGTFGFLGFGTLGIRMQQKRKNLATENSDVFGQISVLKNVRSVPE